VKLVDRKEVAALLKIHINTVDNLKSKGELPYHRIGRSIRFDWDAIEKKLNHPAHSNRMK
jgi:excisionase family DNA binding protein